MGKTKLLIVEDEVITALSLKLRFEKKGFLVCNTAANCEKALDIYRRENPDVVLIDIHLSKGVNGIETCRSIKKDNPNVFTIFMTGFGDEKIKNEAMFLNPLAFLIKPVDVENIANIIKKNVKR